MPARSKAKETTVLTKGGSFVPQADAQSYEAFSLVSKASLQRITLKQLPSQKPLLEQKGSNKDTLITEFLKQWIIAGFKNKTLNTQHLLPQKAVLADYFGVSVGTVQNAIRFLEDEGYVESKQRIGTILRNPAKAVGSGMRKQVSKRDQAVQAIQHWIATQNIQPGQYLPSARDIARALGSAPNTTRLALEYLCHNGVLESMGTRGNKANWLLVKPLESLLSEGSTAQQISSETLIDQLERDIKRYIAQTMTVGAKMPPHLDLANQFKVSIKTVHDTMKRLIAQGIVQAKRGRYGTFVLQVPNPELLPTEQDMALFVPAAELAKSQFYHYEKAEASLIELISTQYQPGQKLAPMGELAEALQVSSNTVRKALQQLATQGLVGFSRGRYGGTTVLKKP